MLADKERWATSVGEPKVQKRFDLEDERGTTDAEEGQITVHLTLLPKNP